MAAVVSLGQTAQCSPCSNLIQELQTRANFWCTRVQVLGAVGKIGGRVAVRRETSKDMRHQNGTASCYAFRTDTPHLASECKGEPRNKPTYMIHKVFQC